MCSLKQVLRKKDLKRILGKTLKRILRKVLGEETG